MKSACQRLQMLVSKNVSALIIYVHVLLVWPLLANELDDRILQALFEFSHCSID